MPDLSISFSSLPTDDEAARLQLFGKCFKELQENWVDMNKGLGTLTTDFSKSTGKVTTSDPLPINRFRFKGFLVDYRLFELQGESTHIFGITNLLSKLTKNSSASAVIKSNTADWHSAGLLAGWSSDFSSAEVINALFNQSLFHTKANDRNATTIEYVGARLGTEALWWETFFVCRQRMQVISNINWMLDPFFRGSSSIRVPENW